MSNRNNPLGENSDVKSNEDHTSPYSSDGNGNEEQQTIHGNAEAKNTVNDPPVNDVNDETLVALQPDVKALSSDRLNESFYNIDGGIDIEGRSTLSEEEVEKKFQELGLAFRTDVMTQQKRLVIRKRLRDQAEKNLEMEFSLTKTKLSKLRYLCYDSESLEQLSDLLRHLDVILATAYFLSASSESYGFVLNEEKMTGAVAIILRQIENIERLQSEISKSHQKENSENIRNQLPPIFDDDILEGRILRRRSVAALALNGPTKRRASIASVPRSLAHSDEENYSFLPLPSLDTFTTSDRTMKKAPVQCSIPKSSRAVSGDQVRNRKESRVEELGIKYIQDYNSHPAAKENDESLLSADDEVPVQDTISHLPVLRMPRSFDNRIRTNATAAETLNFIDSLRDVVKWNGVIVRNSRFQFPENVHQYVPFMITWYVTILIVSIFTAGFLIGFNHCSYPELFLSCSKVSVFITSSITAVSMVIRNRPLKYALLTALAMYAHSLYHTLEEEGPDAMFKRDEL